MELTAIFQSKRRQMVVLTAISLFLHLYIIQKQGLYKDEALYGEVIREFINQPSFPLRYLGEPIAWKPPLMFFLYAPFVFLLKKFALPTEIAYRLPSVFLSVLSLLALYEIAERVSGSRRIAFLSSVVLCFSPLYIWWTNAVITDVLLLFLILLALLLYMRGDRAGFAGAAFFSALAFMTKTYVSLFIPYLAVCFWFLKDRKKLAGMAFLLSLLSIPITAVLYMFMTPKESNVWDVMLFDILKRFFVSDFFVMLCVSILIFMNSTFPISPLYLVGAVRFWKKQPFLSAWLLTILFPLTSAFFLPWYFLPILPPLVIFTAMLLDELLFVRDKIEEIGMVVFVLFLLISTLFIFTRESNDVYLSKEVGIFLSDKKNIVVISHYDPSLIFYRFEHGGSADYDALGFFFYLRNVSVARIVKDYLADMSFPEGPKFTMLDYFNKETFIVKKPEFCPEHLVVESNETPDASLPLEYKNDKYAVYYVGDFVKCAKDI